jgi:hypothetical protein
VLWLLKNEMEAITIMLLKKSYVDIVGFVAKYEEMTELWFFEKFESTMINEYEAVSLCRHYNQENGGLLRCLLLAYAPSRLYGKSMAITAKCTWSHVIRSHVKSREITVHHTLSCNIFRMLQYFEQYPSLLPWLFFPNSWPFL